MEYFKIILATLMGIILLGALGFAFTAVDFASYRFWAPKQENVRREVYENTKSYRDGLRRDFDNLYLQYVSAKTVDEKDAVLSVIRHRASGVDPSFLPTEIANLIRN